MEGSPDLLVILAVLIAAAMVLSMISTMPRLPDHLALLYCWLWDEHDFQVYSVNFDRITREAHEVTRQTHICRRPHCGQLRDIPIEQLL
jgi:hypothetical protein